MRSTLSALLLAGVSLGMTGCSAIKNIDQTQDRAETQSRIAHSLLEQRQQAETQRPLFRVNEGMWVDDKPVAIPKPQPAFLDCEVTYRPQRQVTLSELTRRVSSLCHVSIRITPDAQRYLDPSSTPSAAEASGDAGMEQQLGLPDSSGSSWSGGARSTSMGRVKRVSIDWLGGPLNALLDQVTADLGLSWSYDANRPDPSIEVSYLQSKTFPIYSFAMSSSWSSRVNSGTSVSTGSGAGGGSSGGSDSGVSGQTGSESSSQMTLATDVLADINQDIGTMLTPGVGRMSMSTSTGSVTVKDVPAVIDQVSRYVERLNKLLTQQVVINAKVINVRLSRSDALGIDWGAVYQSAAKSLGIKLGASGNAAINGASQLTFNVLDTSNSTLAGTRAILSALSKQGAVSVSASPSATTTNLQPVPIQVARQTAYLQSSSTTATTDVGLTSELTPGTVTTGLNMNVLPYVLPESGSNEILLQFNISLSSLIALRTVSSGDQSIQVPEIDSRSFSQRVRIRSGETLVLTGFDQTSDSADRSGVGNPNNILLGGQRSAEHQRDVVVILLTPVLRSS
ncbi:PilN family type IVB pilus formation outer membrane protein [Salinicola endophyticus]|uniref:PilN family type IVB pilus formation outer membrane protein n=1 Tax=Salinicola endophyticus TaxID=1949083 RepID=A0AB74UEI1_9GAMM